MFVHLLYGVDIPPGLSTMLCVRVFEKKEESTQQTKTVNFTTNNLNLFHVYVLFHWRSHWHKPRLSFVFCQRKHNMFLWSKYLQAVIPHKLSRSAKTPRRGRNTCDSPSLRCCPTMDNGDPYEAPQKLGRNQQFQGVNISKRLNPGKLNMATWKWNVWKRGRFWLKTHIPYIYTYI